MYTTFEEKDRSEKFASQHEVKRIDFKYEEEEE